MKKHRKIVEYLMIGLLIAESALMIRPFIPSKKSRELEKRYECVREQIIPIEDRNLQRLTELLYENAEASYDYDSSSYWFALGNELRMNLTKRSIDNLLRGMFPQERIKLKDNDFVDKMRELGFIYHIEDNTVIAGKGFQHEETVIFGKINEIIDGCIIYTSLVPTFSEYNGSKRDLAITTDKGEILIDSNAIEEESKRVIHSSQILLKRKYEDLSLDDKLLLRFYQSSDKNPVKIKEGILGSIIEHEKGHRDSGIDNEVQAYINEFSRYPNFYTLYSISALPDDKNGRGYGGIKDKIKEIFQNIGYPLSSLPSLNQEQLYKVAKILREK